VLNLIKVNSDHTRVFTFGIGDGASTSLVKGAARVGRGRAEMVIGKDRLQAKVMRSLKASMQPPICDLHLDWQLPGCSSVVQIPHQLRPLVSGDALILFGIPSTTEVG
jgi:hypothetical protein